MDLTSAAFPVHRAEFGEPAAWRDGVLTVELANRIVRGGRFSAPCGLPGLGVPGRRRE